MSSLVENRGGFEGDINNIYYLGVNDYSSNVLNTSFGGKDFNSSIELSNSSNSFIVDQRISKFIELLSAKNSDASMRAPLLGSSGFTFLCSLSSQHDPERMKLLEPQDQSPIQFVLKAIAKDQAYNETFCSKLFCKYGLSAPEITTTSQSVFTKAAPHMARIKPAFTLNGNHSLIYMPEFKAATLSSLILQKRVLQLTQEEWTRMGICFGETAIFDLVIGNNDRFIRFDRHLPTQNFLGTPSCNSGNIMLEIPMAPSQEKRQLKAIHLIDNAAMNDLIPKPIFDDFSEGLDDIFALFDENDVKPSVKAQTDKNNTSEETADDVFKKLKEIVPHLVNPQKFDLITDHICEGILKEFKQVDEREKEPLNLFIETIKTNLSKGYLQAIEKIKGIDVSDLLKRVDNEEEVKKRLREIIGYNINYIRSIF